jgi:cardiolipin synthase (CMP-forming)
MVSTPLNVPNALSALRIALAPVLVLLAWHGASRAFLYCFALALATDIADGKLARWLRQTSELGARLDSWGDFLTYLAVPLCAYWLRPDLVRDEWQAFAIAVVSYAIPIAIGFAKYHRLTSYHTRAAVLAAYAIGGSTLLAFAGGPTWPFRIAVGVLALAELEEIAITLILPRWRADVPSLRHALQVRRELAPGSDHACHCRTVPRSGS